MLVLELVQDFVVFAHKVVDTKRAAGSVLGMGRDGVRPA